LNREVAATLKHLPSENHLTVRLEDLNYEKYSNVIAPFIGIKPSVSEKAFGSLSEERPNAFNNLGTVSAWNKKEREEFLSEVSETASHFGYDPARILLTDEAKPNVRSMKPKDRKPGNIFQYIMRKLKL
jgi:hypothetical protein